MSRKAFVALLIVVLLPVVGYLLVKRLSEDSITMPIHYYPDTVINKIVNGKRVSDTIWHKVSNFELTNQLGSVVALSDLEGKIIVADFFFTRCPSICPTLTKNMKSLQDGLKKKDTRNPVDTSFVHFLSFSVDPERDSPVVLKKYADKYGINPDVWWLLTGPKKIIYDIALHELKLPAQDGESIDSNFIHSQRFVLLDRNRIVRGYYNGLDTSALSKLAEDLTLLMLERDKNKKRKLF